MRKMFPIQFLQAGGPVSSLNSFIAQMLMQQLTPRPTQVQTPAPFPQSKVGDIWAQGISSAAKNVATALKKRYDDKDKDDNSQTPSKDAAAGDYQAPETAPAPKTASTDTVPIMATPGEHVMNVVAADMFRPILEWMNKLGLQSMQGAQFGGEISPEKQQQRRSSALPAPIPMQEGGGISPFPTRSARRTQGWNPSGGPFAWSSGDIPPSGGPVPNAPRVPSTPTTLPPWALQILASGRGLPHWMDADFWDALGQSGRASSLFNPRMFSTRPGSGFMQDGGEVWTPSMMPPGFWSQPNDGGDDSGGGGLPPWTQNPPGSGPSGVGPPTIPPPGGIAPGSLPNYPGSGWVGPQRMGPPGGWSGTFGHTSEGQPWGNLGAIVGLHLPQRAFGGLNLMQAMRRGLIPRFNPSRTTSGGMTRGDLLRAGT